MLLGVLTLVMFWMKDDEASGTYFRHRQAFDACEHFVRTELLSPPIAVFPDFSGDADSSVTGDGDGPFRVESSVDWENEHGVQVRSEFVCSVLHIGDDTYELQLLELSDADGTA